MQNCLRRERIVFDNFGFTDKSTCEVMQKAIFLSFLAGSAWECNMHDTSNCCNVKALPPLITQQY